MIILAAHSSFAEDLSDSDLAKRFLKPKPNPRADILSSVVLPAIMDTFFEVTFTKFRLDW